VRGVVGKLGKKDQLAVRTMLGELLDA
jgi:hypothetical protein